MLTKPTVFILGAGASHDCGYPLARELMFDIANKSVLNQNYKLSPTRIKPLYSILNSTKIDYNRFCTVLLRSQAQSIDIFLENTQDYIDIGKCAIAAELISHEDYDNLIGGRDKKNRWYEYLFEELGRRRIEFEDSINHVTFLTFNYDRSLEYFFLYSLEFTFNLSIREAAELASRIKIIHLYGQLGAPYGLTSSGRDYSSKLTPNIIRETASQIIIPDQAFKPTPQFIEAYQLLHNAKKIVFLGFGYHRENVQRLLGTVEFNSQCDIIGTGLGMGAARIRQAENLFPNRKITIYDKSIIDLIRDVSIFE